MRGRPVSCCFTGHRPAKLPWRHDEDDPRCVALKRRIRDAVEAAYAEGYRHFLCGMAMGCDLYLCECVLALREGHPDVSVEPSPVPPRRTPGQRTSGSGTPGWWPPATMRRWCRPNIPPAACSGGTGTWWTTLHC